MSILSDLTQTTGTSTTTLPSWYDQAQQQLLQNAQQAYSSAPSLSQTTAQQAINTLQGPQNPFTQAQGTLGTIASGAANPWTVDPTTGAVSPNTGTAMGALFSAQQNQLNQLLPTMTAQQQACAIGSGNFGSLRGQTAVDTAKANALANLQAAQTQAALQNQQTGVQAGAQLGSVGQQGINALMNVGQTQMTSPFVTAANLGNIMASMPVGQTVATSQTPSVLQQIGGLGAAATGLLNTSVGGKTLGQTISGGLSKLTNPGAAAGCAAGCAAGAGCTVGCATGCTVGCVTGCTIGCATGCTVGCIIG